MPGRRGRGTCLASPGAKRDAATRHPSAGGRPGARARNHEREPELALILTGELGEGQQLPSIRALAGDLRISVITTKRAYAELELQGFIETVPGKGSFVAGGNLELLREERLRHIEELLVQAVDEARGANVGIPELHDMLDLIAESDD